MNYFGNLKFLTFQKVLLIILPPSLIFSIFVADLIVSVLFLFFIYHLFKHKNYVIIDNLYFKIFFLIGFT